MFIFLKSLERQKVYMGIPLLLMLGETALAGTNTSVHLPKQFQIPMQTILWALSKSVFKIQDLTY